ncbi:PTS fructose transporter subunit IIC [Fervidobacterium thailandense]|uniref:PTS fructose transporter subunit IIBC n=1 Tax=Fervidobacterium thailandense TaxID=1008305 RepID=A0A1E3G1D2_9BACT|nr:fructose-specific PTS transporter subunit EIIC [Fervidobacterium thailandense]ODN29950.1 PTS fructose transporter subunit IIBC [Fervidobacterium thailandense]
MSKLIVAVTACPTGIAHTYMAAESLKKAAAELGYEIKVETRGSVGVENELTPEDIKRAEVVILAADISVPRERFAGKRIYETSVQRAIKAGKEVIEEALKSAKVDYVKKVEEIKQQRSAQRKGAYRHLLNGVSYMIPFVVAGGIAIALSFAWGYKAFENEGTLPWALMKIGGGSAFALMVPILAGFIAYSIADRAGLAAGMIGGMLASATGSGFLGGILAGFIAGYFVQFLKKTIKMPRGLEGLMPVLIIPVLSSLFVGLVMIYVVGKPVAAINTALNNALQNLSGTNAILLGFVLGVMMAFDMGGPVNKAAYTFGVGTIAAGQPSAIMAAVMAAGMTPPLGLALATILFRNKFTEEEIEAGKAAWVLGISFITEGAIPFAAADPLRVIPSIMIGSGITGALSMLFQCKLPVPHGGIFVFWAVENLIPYLFAMLVGTVVTAVLVGVLKPRQIQIFEAAR